jgi:hypothetical protein
MGNWHISISGVGAHHNKLYEKDANRMAAEFVQRLRDAGHNVTRHEFHSSSLDDIDGKSYLATRDELEKSQG